MQLQQEQEQSIFARIGRAEAGAAIAAIIWMLLVVAALALLTLISGG